jgi:Ca2+-binding EF-hand superfamily protein
MDSNGNGMLEPDELGDRGRYMVERAGLDPRRPVSVNQLEQSMRERFSQGGGGPPGGGYFGSRGSSGSYGSRDGGSYGSRDGGGWSRDGGSRDGGGYSGRSWGGGGGYGGSSSSSSSYSVASIAPTPAAAEGVQGFGVETILVPVPGFGQGVAALGIDREDMRYAEEKLREGDRNRDGFVDPEEGRREDMGPDFFAYDRNGDGKLVLEEIAARYQARRLARMNAKPEQRDFDEAREIIRRYDRNNDAMLDDRELRESRYADEYRRYDLNKDGKVSQDELAKRSAGRRINNAPIPTARPGSTMAGVGNSSRPAMLSMTTTRPPTPPPVTTSRSSSSNSSSRSSSSSSGSGAPDQRTLERVEERMRETDTNKDGSISKEEFEANRGEFRGGDMSSYDPNGDGRITKEELIQRFTNFSRGFGGSSPGGGGWFGGSRDGSGGGGWSGSGGDGRSGGSSGSSRDSSATNGTTNGATTAKKSYRFLSATERLDGNLPEWFKNKDANSDGQIAMAEFSSIWTEKEAGEFQRADLNGDGIITAKECLMGPTVTAPSGGSSGTSSATSSSTGGVKLVTAEMSREERSRKVAEEIVKKYDKNGNQGLDGDETKDVRGLPRNPDKDGDGKITVEEIVAGWLSR